ncbi:hypothetical protein ACJIZ3_017691 [Penstemon smallii]|uniref:Uncharacterized protein n=1 Tax=Penstemon smallii TaxID=265156 RepID=A0ABD3SW94_9LAMI
MGGKFEITPTDGKETDNAYEDLYVHVSADTFEKVDAAVALIELLVTPVSVNPVSSSSSTTVSGVNMNNQPSQSTPSSIVAPINQGMAQPYTGTLPPLQGQIPQYPQPWLYPQSGLLSPAVSSAPLLTNPVQVSSSPFQPSTTPSLIGPRPVMAPSFSSVWENPSLHSRPQFPHALHPPHLQQVPLLGQSSGPRNTLGPSHNVRPFMSALPQPSTFESNRWPQSPMSTSASQGLTNFMPMASQNTVFPGASASAPFAIQPPQVAIPRPQQPNSGDFTFQPHLPPNAAASQVAWQSTQHAHHNITPQNQSGQAPPQPPLMRPMNSSPVFPRPHMNQPMQQIYTNFAGNPMGPPPPPPPPPRHPAVQGHNFLPPHPMNNSAGPFPPRPGSQMHLQQNHPFGANRPQMFPTPHQHFGNHPIRPFGSSSGGQQVYDPFSPTSTSFNPRMSGNAAKLQNENDPEYDDLMASVGVQ